MKQQTPKRGEPPASHADAAVSPESISKFCAQLTRNEPVRRTLPGNGRLHIDRQLPFLCVYRQSPNADDPGTRQLIEPADLVTSRSPNAVFALTPPAARTTQAGRSWSRRRGSRSLAGTP
ncbi:MAG: hypothetical protein ACI9KE_006101 [Polyangiales bacterium]|jgi:hypothetical protein